jgi:hypothetical protein
MSDDGTLEDGAPPPTRIERPTILVSRALPFATILATQLGCTEASEAYEDALAGHRN